MVVDGGLPGVSGQARPRREALHIGRDVPYGGRPEWSASSRSARLRSSPSVRPRFNPRPQPIRSPARRRVSSRSRRRKSSPASARVSSRANNRTVCPACRLILRWSLPAKLHRPGRRLSHRRSRSRCHSRRFRNQRPDRGRPPRSRHSIVEVWRQRLGVIARMAGRQGGAVCSPGRLAAGGISVFFPIWGLAGGFMLRLPEIQSRQMALRQTDRLQRTLRTL